VIEALLSINYQKISLLKLHGHGFWMADSSFPFSWIKLKSRKNSEPPFLFEIKVNSI